MSSRPLFSPIFFLLVLVGVHGKLHSQQIVRSVIFERSDVFDSSDSTTPGWVKTFFNTLHTTSRERLLRNEILFHENDVVQPLLLAESERKLRRLYFVGDVSIGSQPDRDSCDVVIRTHDKWSLTTNASFKRDGGFESYGFALSESNFLGMGYGLLGSVDYKTDRSRPFGSQFFYIGKHLPFRGWETNIQYKSSEELTVRSLGITHPFFSEESPWSFGLSVNDGTSLRRLFADGQIVQQEQASQATELLWGVASVGDEVKYRFGFSFMHRTTAGIVLLPRNDDRLSMAQVSFGILGRSWEKTVSLNSLTRVEDLPTGFALDFIVGRNFDERSNTGLPDYYLARGITAVNFGHRTYVSPEISYTRAGAFGEESEQTLLYTLLVHHRFAEDDLIIWRMTGTQGYGWPAGETLVLGSPSGLRGYGQYALSGNRMVLFNLESRHVFNTPVWIFYFGTAAFADCGAVWRESQDFAHQRFHSAVGLGLRIENIKQQGIGVIRIDFPFSLDRRRIAGIVVSSSYLLSAFADIDNLPPHF